jgi:hypothetical protein
MNTILQSSRWAKPSDANASGGVPTIDIIEKKFRKDGKGNATGYGLKIFP